jgi:RNA polymerase sigma factor (sigma-70 family)
VEASRVLEEAVQDEEFERFYRDYAKHVYRYTLAVLRNAADAEDITQTTFLNAYRAMRQGERPRRPHNWLIKIAHNACRSRYLRLARRPREVPLDETVEQLAVPPEERPNIQALLAALGRLPFNQRAALVMRELEGRSYAEIASTLGVSVPAVEMLIFRARKAMRTRASSLRSLGAVQLPASLATWLEGGGVVAGGSALVGTGIAVKAALALTAAAVVAGGVKATELKGSTARKPEAAVVVSSPAVSSVRPVARSTGVVVLQRGAVATRSAPGRYGVMPRAQALGTDGASATVAETASTHESATSGSSSAPSAPAPTETVAQTVSSVPSAPTPSVPSVSPPPVALPVTVPPVPELPPPPPLPPPPKLP